MLCTSGFVVAPALDSADKREATATPGLLLLHEHCNASAASASFATATSPYVCSSASTTWLSPFLLEGTKSQL